MQKYSENSCSANEDHLSKMSKMIDACTCKGVFLSKIIGHVLGSLPKTKLFFKFLFMLVIKLSASIL